MFICCVICTVTLNLQETTGIWLNITTLDGTVKKLPRVI